LKFPESVHSRVDHEKDNSAILWRIACFGVYTVNAGSVWVMAMAILWWAEVKRFPGYLASPGI